MIIICEFLTHCDVGDQTNLFFFLLNLGYVVLSRIREAMYSLVDFKGKYELFYKMCLLTAIFCRLYVVRLKYSKRKNLIMAQNCIDES